jgi:hypothetical protein
MKKLIVPVLALSLVVGCGQNSAENQAGNEVSGENNTAKQDQNDTATTEAAPVTITPVSMTSLTPFASDTAFNLNYAPGVHQIIDKEKERTFLLVSLPHIAFGTDLEVADLTKQEEGHQVTLQYTESEGEKSSMSVNYYELSGEMNQFTAVDQNGNVWASSTVTNDDEFLFTFDPKYRITPALDQNLRITTPGFGAGIEEDATSLNVTGYVHASEAVTVSLVQGDNVISTAEFAGTAGKWTPFTASLSVEGIELNEGAEDIHLIFEGEEIQENWIVNSF